MDLTLFGQQIDALTQIVTGLSNIRESDDHLIGAYQGELLGLINRASEVGCSRPDLLARAHRLTQLLVELAERDDLTLCHEMDHLLREYNATGQPVTRRIPLSRSKPLAAFPKEPPVVHTVFVDEAGSASFEEASQPVLCLTGILVEDRRIDEFAWATDALIARYGVKGTAEIHAHAVLAGADPFGALSVGDRDSLLQEFVKLGLDHALGVHYLSMLKPFVTSEFRTALQARGLDAYTANVLYFNVALKAAAFGRIGVAQYRYLFDRTDRYGRDIRRIVRALKTEANPGLRLHALAGEPIAVDSKDHRFVQLADTIGYFLARYRQFEVNTYQPREVLRKHEEKYRTVYSLVQPKVMSFVRDGLYRMVDWKGVQEWSAPARGKPKADSGIASGHHPPTTPRNAPCGCGSGRKFKKCHGR